MSTPDPPLTSQRFFVGGPLPGLNEILAAAKSGHGKGNAYSRMKRDWSEAVVYAALSARVKPMAGRVAVTFEWREKTARRDPDNVHAGAKFVLDGLVACGVLEGDSQRYIARITHEPIRLVETALGAGVMVTLEAAKRRATPVPFRDLLIGIAENCRQSQSE